LVPIFAVLWGAVALDEKLTVQMFLGGIIVLAGTALSTGAIKPKFRVKIPDELQSIENNK
jgi:drug/metabolite transporter (DMT)-like permease